MLRRNVLIFHNAALGDFVLTWPIAIAAARVLAQSRIKYVTAHRKGELAERWIGVESVDVEAGWHTLHADSPKLPEMPTRLLQAMQMAIVFSKDRDERFIGNITQIAGDVPVVHLSPNPPGGVHVWEHHLNQLAPWPVLQNAVVQVQRLIDTHGAITTPSAKDQAIVIHPGSGAARKNWPIEHFVSLSALLKNEGLQTVFTLGEVEQEQFGAAALSKLKKAGKVVACDTLLSLADQIGRGVGFVGNDSGPTHLAAMIGKPTTALFGSTSDPDCWRPRGPNVRVVPFESTPQEVADALIEMIESQKSLKQKVHTRDESE